MEYIDLTPRLGHLNAVGQGGASVFARVPVQALALVKQGVSELYSLFNVVIRRVLAYVFSPYIITCLAVFFVLNRTLVFSATREPVRLSLRARLFLRGIAMAFLCYPAKYLLDIVNGAEINTKWILQSLQQSFVVNSFVELFSSVVQGKAPIYDPGYSFFEFSLIFQDVRSQYSNTNKFLPRDIAILGLLTISAQIFTNIMALCDLRRYRLISSTVIGVSFMAHFIYLHAVGRLWNYPALAVLSHLRYVPQILVLIVVALCWSIYGFTALVVGDRSKMVARRGFAFDYKDSFYQTVFKLGYDALEASVDKTYLHEAASMYWPVATWIDRMHISHLENVTAIAPDGTVVRMRGFSSNPYANEIVDPPRLDNRDIKRQQADFAKAIPQSISGFLATYRLSRAALTVAFCRLRGMLRSTQPAMQSTVPPPQSRVSKLLYGSLDHGHTEAYWKILAGAALPEVDDSKDYVPTDNEDDEDEDDDDEIIYDDSDSGESDYEDDVSMCAENILDEAVGNRGVELVRLHMSSERAITRGSYLESLDPSRELGQVLLELRRGTNLSKCAVCLENSRQIVLWPCRCLALCDECRLTLSARRFRRCVCCQQPVHSYSKLYVP